MAVGVVGLLSASSKDLVRFRFADCGRFLVELGGCREWEEGGCGEGGCGEGGGMGEVAPSIELGDGVSLAAVVPVCACGCPWVEQGG